MTAMVFLRLGKPLLVYKIARIVMQLRFKLLKAPQTLTISCQLAL